MSEEDLEALAALTCSGFTLQEAMNLAENRKNQECFRRIRTLLESGRSPSDFLGMFVPYVYRCFLQRFLKVLPFSQSLSLALEIVKQDRKLKKEYRKGLYYPVMLFGLTIAGIALFNELCFPPLLSMMKEFSRDNTGLQGVRMFLRIFCILVSAVSLLFLIIFLFFTDKKHQVRGYALFQKIFPDSVITQYISRQFVFFFRQCIRRNISTRETMQILMNTTEKPVISVIAQKIDQSLKSGKSFENALDTPFLDTALCRLLKIAVYSSDMENMLDGYLEIAQQQAERKCRRITYAVQLLSYASIGLILILVYQILMLPLQIISSL
ncbi:MAG: type II secretion system F family protein [Solobacterium sp.]|nr:type II secretion system F family protein [Solobacterium sp.]